MRDEFVSIEALSGIVLLLAAAVALVWVNIGAGTYQDVWGHELTIGVGDIATTLDVQHWVNDGLMAVFFFVVGLEIKRELTIGELSDPKNAATPVLAAVGGMVIPALVFVAFTSGGDGARGWGIPMATDIAFALGVLALLGPRIPTGAKLFLLTLAIVDDIGAILVIALFYSEGVDGTWLAGAAATVLAIVLLRRFRSPLLFIAPALVLWVCMHESGVHATVAGVVLGLLTPATRDGGEGPLQRLERSLHPWSSFVVIPVFALANAGVALSGESIDRAVSSLTAAGVAFGLVIGKPVGILLATVLAVRLLGARLPPGVRLVHVVGVGLVAGIGFAVSLFIADLSFSGRRLAEVKIAVLAASAVAGTVGAGYLAVTSRRRSSAAGSAP